MRGEFTGPLVVQYIDGPNPFKIMRQFSFIATAKGRTVELVVNNGMEFDGTSMPRGTRWLIQKSDPQLLQCAAGHDAGFKNARLIEKANGKTTRRKASRREVNALMGVMMRTERVPKWKRTIIMTGLFFGSRKAWKVCRRRDG